MPWFTQPRLSPKDLFNLARWWLVRRKVLNHQWMNESIGAQWWQYNSSGRWVWICLTFRCMCCLWDWHRTERSLGSCSDGTYTGLVSKQTMKSPVPPLQSGGHYHRENRALRMIVCSTRDGASWREYRRGRRDAMCAPYWDALCPGLASFTSVWASHSPPTQNTCWQCHNKVIIIMHLTICAVERPVVWWCDHDTWASPSVLSTWSVGGGVHSPGSGGWRYDSGDISRLSQCPHHVI